MPAEIPRPKTPFIQAIMDEAIGQQYLLHREVVSVANRYEVELLGDGAESVVIPDENDEESVISFPYKETGVARAKSIYYRQRILNLLFPYNFPHISAAIGGEKGAPYRTGTKRERVWGGYPVKEILPFGDIMSLECGDESIVHSFCRVLDAIKHFELPIILDTSSCNFVITDTGDVVYMDVPDTGFQGFWNMEKLRACAEYFELNEGDVESVLSAAARLEDLEAPEACADRKNQ